MNSSATMQAGAFVNTQASNSAMREPTLLRKKQIIYSATQASGNYLKYCLRRSAEITS